MLADRVAVAAVRVPPPNTTAAATTTAMADNEDSPLNMFSQSNTVMNTTPLLMPTLWFVIRRCVRRLTAHCGTQTHSHATHKHTHTLVEITTLAPLTTFPSLSGASRPQRCVSKDCDVLR